MITVLVQRDVAIFGDFHVFLLHARVGDFEHSCRGEAVAQAIVLQAVGGVAPINQNWESSKLSLIFDEAAGSAGFLFVVLSAMWTL